MGATTFDTFYNFCWGLQKIFILLTWTFIQETSSHKPPASSNLMNNYYCKMYAAFDEDLGLITIIYCQLKISCMDDPLLLNASSIGIYARHHSIDF